MAEDLANKQVLVTGADGFIGSHLVEALVKRNACVRALVLYNSWNQIGWLQDVPRDIIAKIEVFHGDVRDRRRMEDAVASCEYVFHLASLIAIPYSYKAVQSFVDTNISGTLNILYGCLASNRLVRLVQTSTSEVYGTAQTVPISESHPLVGQSPYAASKIAADKLAESFHRSFSLPVVTARPFNTFGPRQTARAVIPTICSQLLTGARELRLGSLTPTRDFNFVEDTVQGLISLALCPAAVGKAVNIGTGREWSIRETAELLMEITGKKLPIVCEAERLRPAGSEVDRLVADNRLIAELTDWHSAFDFSEALRISARWIGANPHHFRAEQFSI